MNARSRGGTTIPPPSHGYREMLMERENTIEELKETIEIMEVKIQKLEQLLKLKDSKLMTLTNKLQEAGIDLV
jgi:hypothetical protein